MDYIKHQFDNNFFYDALLMRPINNREFVVHDFVIDSREIKNPEYACFIGIKGNNYNGNNFFKEAYKKNVRIFILDKYPTSIPKDAIIFVVPDTILTLGKLAHCHKKKIYIPYLMITGSVGKTTTRLLISQALNYKYPVHTAKKNWNNSIGLPLSILEMPRDAKIAILEAGMSHKDEIKTLSEIVNPEMAIITNIGHSHMENFRHLDEIAEAKIEIVDGMSSSSLLMINRHDRYRSLFESSAKGDVAYFDPDDIIIMDSQLSGFSFRHRKLPGEEFFSKIPGDHFTLNLSILFLCAEVLQIPVEYLRKGLESDLSLLENRMNIFENQGITVIADSYNASLESFSAAFQVLTKSQGRTIAVIADILELGRHAESIHRQLGDMIEALGTLDYIMAFGTSIEFTCQNLKRTQYSYYTCQDTLLHDLQSIVKSGDTVLIKGSNGMGLSKIVDYFKSC